MTTARTVTATEILEHCAIDDVRDVLRETAEDGVDNLIEDGRLDDSQRAAAIYLATSAIVGALNGGREGRLILSVLDAVSEFQGREG